MTQARIENTWYPDAGYTWADLTTDTWADWDDDWLSGTVGPSGFSAASIDVTSSSVDCGWIGDWLPSTITKFEGDKCHVSYEESDDDITFVAVATPGVLSGRYFKARLKVEGNPGTQVVSLTAARFDFSQAALFENQTVDTSTLGGTVDARVLVFNKTYAQIVGLVVTASDGQVKPFNYMPGTTTATQVTFRLSDMNAFDPATSLDATVKFAITGLPGLVYDNTKGSVARRV